MRLVWLLLFLSACATDPEPHTKAHPATWISDAFPVEQGMPVREVKPGQEFFFKRCALEGRRPYTTNSEYSCTSPF